jgi:hypothetical protein
MADRRCQYCDKPGFKSIDIEVDDYIKTLDKKYYHTNCYREYLNKKGKLFEEISGEVQFLKEVMSKELQEEVEKDQFYKWIKEYYNATIPAYYAISITEVRNGTHKYSNEPIDYATLLDLFQHMGNYLNKNANKLTSNGREFKTISHRMNYDLVVVLGNYTDYKNYKAKEQVNEIETIKVIN